MLGTLMLLVNALNAQKWSCLVGGWTLTFVVLTDHYFCWPLEQGSPNANLQDGFGVHPVLPPSEQLLLFCLGQMDYSPHSFSWQAASV